MDFTAFCVCVFLFYFESCILAKIKLHFRASQMFIKIFCYIMTVYTVLPYIVYKDIMWLHSQYFCF